MSNGRPQGWPLLFLPNAPLSPSVQICDTTTTATESRRNLLLRSAVQISEPSRFLFATFLEATAHLTDTNAPSLFDKVWIRGKEFLPHAATLENLPEGVSPD
jgi:hypothetical protein